MGQQNESTYRGHLAWGAGCILLLVGATWVGRSYYIMNGQNEFLPPIAPLAVDQNPNALSSAKVFPIWKSITIGTYRDVNDLNDALLRAGAIDDGDLVSKVITESDFTVSTTNADANLVNISLRDLGFSGSPVTLEDIYKRAQGLGLDLCPAEVGPQLQLQYNNQRQGEVLIIAMKPIRASNGLDVIFNLHKDLVAGDIKEPVGSWLGLNSWSPTLKFGYADHWVFVRRK